MTLRAVLQIIYIGLIRVIGVAVLGFSALFLWQIGSPAHPGLGHWFPLIAVLLTLTLAAIYVVPRLSPRWLTHPQGLLPGLAVAGLHAVAPLLFMVPIMGGIIATGMAEPLSRQLSVGASALVWVMCGVAWWLGVILSVWRIDPPAIVPIFTQPPTPREEVDMRALRKSRSA